MPGNERGKNPNKTLENKGRRVLSLTPEVSICCDRSSFSFARLVSQNLTIGDYNLRTIK